MTRGPQLRLQDVIAACEAIGAYVADAGGHPTGMAYDAVRMRLLEIGEATKDIDPKILQQEPEIEWKQVAGMRDRIAHNYFDTQHGIVVETATTDVPQMLAAAKRLLAGLT